MKAKTELCKIENDSGQLLAQLDYFNQRYLLEFYNEFLGIKEVCSLNWTNARLFVQKIEQLVCSPLAQSIPVGVGPVRELWFDGTEIWVNLGSANSFGLAIAEAKELIEVMNEVKRTKTMGQIITVKFG